MSVPTARTSIQKPVSGCCAREQLAVGDRRTVRQLCADRRTIARRSGLCPPALVGQGGRCRGDERVLCHKFRRRARTIGLGQRGQAAGEFQAAASADRGPAYGGWRSWLGLPVGRSARRRQPAKRRPPGLSPAIQRQSG